MICPCKDCTRRTLTCHGFCKGYAEWKAEREQANARRRSGQEVSNYRIEVSIRLRGRKR